MTADEENNVKTKKPRIWRKNDCHFTYCVIIPLLWGTFFILNRRMTTKSVLAEWKIRQAKS